MRTGSTSNAIQLNTVLLHPEKTCDVEAKGTDQAKESAEPRDFEISSVGMILLEPGAAVRPDLMSAVTEAVLNTVATCFACLCCTRVKRLSGYVVHDGAASPLPGGVRWGTKVSRMPVHEATKSMNPLPSWTDIPVSTRWVHTRSAHVWATCHAAAATRTDGCSNPAQSPEATPLSGAARRLGGRHPASSAPRSACAGSGAAARFPAVPSPA